MTVESNYVISIAAVSQCRSKGNISGGARERRRRELLGGLGVSSTRKILKSKGLEILFV